MKTPAIRKLVYSGILCAVGVLLPQLAHLVGGNVSGAVLLPMHIPVLLAGFAAGPLSGAVVGLVSPLLSALLTGMPAFARLPFMMIELCVYGVAAGLLYHLLRRKVAHGSIYLTLIGAMLAGRAAYALSLLVACDWLGLPGGGVIAVVSATATGLPGILIQLVLLPPIVFALKKGGLLLE